MVAERKERIEADAVNSHIERLRTLCFVTDDGHDDLQVITLCRRYRLSGYDAAYLETAKRRGARLATLDRKLGAASAKEAVSMDAN